MTVTNTPRMSSAAIRSLARISSFSARSFTLMPSVTVISRVIGCGSSLNCAAPPKRGGGTKPFIGPSLVFGYCWPSAARHDFAVRAADAVRRRLAERHQLQVARHQNHRGVERRSRGVRRIRDVRRARRVRRVLQIQCACRVLGTRAARELSGRCRDRWVGAADSLPPGAPVGLRSKIGLPR